MGLLKKLAPGLVTLSIGASMIGYAYLNYSKSTETVTAYNNAAKSLGNLEAIRSMSRGLEYLPADVDGETIRKAGFEKTQSLDVLIEKTRRDLKVLRENPEVEAYHKSNNLFGLLIVLGATSISASIAFSLSNLTTYLANRKTYSHASA